MSTRCLTLKTLPGMPAGWLAPFGVYNMGPVVGTAFVAGESV